MDNKTHFPNLTSPASVLAVDLTNSDVFRDIKDQYPRFSVYNWNHDLNCRENFDALLALVEVEGRTKLILANPREFGSILVVALLALGEGIDVYICADLVRSQDSHERMLLFERLRQHGAIIITLLQIKAEFQAITEY